MQKSKKIRLTMIFLFISTVIVIPNLLISVQRDIEILVDERDPNDFIDTRPPITSTVFYEDTTKCAQDVYVSGDYAYVADDDSGLAIINISDPTNPGTPVYVDLTGPARGVYVSGDYAYLAARSSGLAIVDVSDPENPGTPVYEDTTEAWDVYVSGDYAYVADLWDGLTIINVSDPTDPGTPISEYAPFGATRIYVSGDYAYITNYTGLAVVNISDPTNPGTPVYENTNGTSWDIYVSGGYAYVGNGNSGLAVFDVSDPTNLGTPIYENTTGRAYGVYVSGGYAYVGDDTSGLAVINISDPSNPGIPDYIDTTGSARGVFVSGDYVYVADCVSGLAVISIIDSTDPVITVNPDNVNVEYGYTGESLSWTAIDDNPGNYTIELIGTGTVATSTPWVNNTPVAYNIPDGLGVGSHAYTIIFKDNYSNFISASVSFTVEDTTTPSLTSSSSDLTVEFGYTGQSISWTATDLSPNTYTIELQGSGIVAGPTTWTSGLAITYIILDGSVAGVYNYSINFMDDYGNFIIDSVIFTVEAIVVPPEGGISYGNVLLIFIGVSVIYLILTKRRHIVNKSR